LQLIATQALPHIDLDRIRTSRRYQISEMARPGATLDTKQDPVAYPRHACPHRLYDGQERIAGKGEDRVGVVEE
jgi:hypothetical protein